MTNYYETFENWVYVCLGGLDMAEDFLQHHPRFRESMKLWAEYHENKGGAAWKGAAIWYKRVAYPQIKRDREFVQAIDWR